MIRIALLGVFCLHAASAQVEVEALAREVVELKLAPQAAVMVVHDGKRYFASSGGVEANALVRVGSISKVLAGALLANMVSEGKVKLDDPVASFAPTGVRLPQAMTLLELATHTSGAPRNGNGADAWKAVANAKMLWPAGSGAQYSNIGFWLLGAALQRAGGQDYETLLRGRVMGPLGMSDTTARPSAEQCGRLVKVAEFPCADQSAVASTAGMYSTASNMARWLEHLLAVRDAKGRVAQAMYVRRDALARAEGLDSGGHADGIGLGWIHLDRAGSRPALMSKTGGQDGFLSYIAFAPGRRTGVFAVIATMDLEASRKMAVAVNALIEKLEGR